MRIIYTLSFVKIKDLFQKLIMHNEKNLPLIEIFRDIVPTIFLVFRNESINPSCIIYCKHKIISFELVFNVPESVVRDTFNGLFGGFNYSENKFDGFAVYSGYVFLYQFCHLNIYSSCVLI